MGLLGLGDLLCSFPTVLGGLRLRPLAALWWLRLLSAGLRAALFGTRPSRSCPLVSRLPSACPCSHQFGGDPCSLLCRSPGAPCRLVSACLLLWRRPRLCLSGTPRPASWAPRSAAWPAASRRLVLLSASFHGFAWSLPIGAAVPLSMSSVCMPPPTALLRLWPTAPLSSLRPSRMLSNLGKSRFLLSVTSSRIRFLLCRKRSSLFPGGGILLASSDPPRLPVAASIGCTPTRRLLLLWIRSPCAGASVCPPTPPLRFAFAPALRPCSIAVRARLL